MKKIISICFLLLSSSIFSASALFHAVIAEKWLEKFENYNEEQKRDFILGNLFPDIRYLAGLPRETTHNRQLTIEDVRQAQDPFTKGIYLHNVVDAVRWNFEKKSGIVARITTPGDKILHLKMVEDEILYSLRPEGSSDYICEYQEYIAKGELNYGISVEILEKWHAINRIYFQMRPGDLFEKCNRDKSTISGIDLKELQLAYDMIEKYRDDDDFKKYVAGQMSEFDALFEKAP